MGVLLNPPSDACDYVIHAASPDATEYRPRLAFGKKLNEQVPIIILN